MEDKPLGVSAGPTGASWPGSGELGALLGALDWSKTPIGPPARWPQSLRTALSFCLASPLPMAIWWGSSRTQFYNDAYRPILGDKHPQSLGQSGHECWGEVWPVCGPLDEHVMATGESTVSPDLQFRVARSGCVEEAFVTFAFSPIRDEQGAIGGTLITATETTQRVVGERRLRTLRDLGSRANDGKTTTEACRIAAATLAANPYDIPFALLYLLDAGGRFAQLVGSAGVEPGLPMSPASIEFDRADDPWPLAAVVRTGQAAAVQISSALPSLQRGAWPDPPHTALVLPITFAGMAGGVLVAAVSPGRALDAAYRAFFDLVAGHIATAVANAHASEEKRKDAEALTELDRAKTAFFSNVSHEFRTPLTLMLSPLEEMLASAAPAEREGVAIVHRNALRLLRLIDTLLDFSRIEAGRLQAIYEPTDLARYTSNLAGVFRGPIEAAGLRLVVDCASLAEPVYVDHQMWEKIVFNLLSNAFKFTFEGEIRVTLRNADDHVELIVADTGIGIPENELPHVFERFHRVRDARARTHEGTGIGLALVRELITSHHGTVGVSSEVGRGTTFTVSLAKGHAHLPADRIRAAGRTAGSTGTADAYTAEMSRWLVDDFVGADSAASGELPPAVDAAESSRRPRILLADDDADMRQYVGRLLERRWTVETVADGRAALAAARERPPDLILTDVMMPALDGFAVVRELRADPRTRTIPVIMLSARADEESRGEGLDAGVGDYLIKPFSARELMARVNTQLALARSRRESEERFRALADAAPVMIWISNPDTGRTFFNKPWREFTGRTMEEEIGDGWADGLHAEDAPRAIDLYLTAFKQRENFRMEYRLRRHDGVFLWVLDTGVPQYAPDGAFLGYIGSCIDIDARHQIEAEREEMLQREQMARAEAEAANRGKDEFLATLSHELRTPLNAILGWSRMLKTGALDERTTRRAISVIERSASLQEQLIGDLLEVSRIITGKMQLTVVTVDLGAVIESAIDAVRHAAEAKQLRIEVHVRNRPCTIRGDADRLQQVTWNLLSNAIKFTPRGGGIRVTLESHDDAVITVSDTGEGIAPEFLPYLFDRFRQADATTTRAHGGLGLGLALVRYLVELHGGTVSADSPGKGQGATFTVRLPARGQQTGTDRDRAPEIGGASEPDRDMLPLAKVQVLVVEDDADSRDLLSTVLRNAGAEVTAVAGVQDAVDAFERARPNVILSDIGLPDADGYDLIRKIRSFPEEHGGRTPAAAVTAYARAEDHVRALRAGFNVHLTKPLEPSQILTIVAKLAQQQDSRPAA